ncbi:carbamoyltransferase HypF [Candidatus Lokiarchaeum ossiferum]|uniref:carbamoyltransferase HypF n=1 Tax=Candidatus Lokiarchaeum ossiferum TaxID=2951803 RepID=UPI00352E7A97
MKQQQIIITGIVQGVGFRPFLFNLLDSHHLTGTIKNTGNLGVTLDLQSPDPKFNFERLALEIRAKIPAMALIEDITVSSPKEVMTSEFKELKIIPSNDGIGKGLTLPPDIAMCDECFKDFTNPDQKRFFHYPFIACAQCGPRYTIMKALPYDRPNSTVKDFPFCEGCEQDYSDRSNRRFHAQTFNCNHCGPFYFLATLESPNPRFPEPNALNELIIAIKEGKIVAIKGIGGVNLVCRADDEKVIQKLRNRKRERKNKPFAIMVADQQAILNYCHATPKQMELISSFRRPILLLPKKEKALPENLAPGLHNIGVLLPYMGLHHLLFQNLLNIPLVFTSGNISSLPMAVDNIEILTHLDGIADLFFLHNREIFQRCDDSVIRPVLNNPAIIRRSRGYIPEYIKLPFEPKCDAILAVGAELNSTGAIARGPRIFPTQHIGNVRNLETYEFLESALHHLQTLLKIDDCEIGCIARDLHPSFQSTRLALKIAEKLRSQLDEGQIIPIKTIQHHHAHLASLMVDHQLPLEEKILVLTLDGVGYGKDHQPWGGEILLGGYHSFTRIAHLNPIAMIGGDLCAKNPARMLLCELHSAAASDIDRELIEALIQKLDLISYFPHKTTELKVLKTQIANLPQTTTKYPFTSSLGRLLDAAASLFNVCHQRTYRGEPAMRLEGFAWGSKYEKRFDLTKFHTKEIIYGEKLLFEYAKLLFKATKSPTNEDMKNLAYGFHCDIAELFTNIAISTAKTHKIQKIGVSGGIAYNEIIMQTIKKLVEDANLTFLQHNRIPPGDAGISVGQIAIAAAQTTNET